MFIKRKLGKTRMTPIVYIYIVLDIKKDIHYYIFVGEKFTSQNSIHVKFVTNFMYGGHLKIPFLPGKQGRKVPLFG